MVFPSSSTGKKSDVSMLLSKPLALTSRVKLGKSNQIAASQTTTQRNSPAERREREVHVESLNANGLAFLGSGAVRLLPGRRGRRT